MISYKVELRDRRPILYKVEIRVMALDAVAGAMRERRDAERRTRALDKVAAAPPRADVELIASMAAGDRQSHRLLYERHATAILRYLIGRLDGDKALAEEVLQEVMLAAWQAAADFRGASRVSTWLFGIAHHRAANTLRRRRREVLSEDPTTMSAARQVAGTIETGRRDSRQVDHRVDLDRALADLPDAQRAALELVFYHGLPVVEAAMVLGVAPGTVKSRLFRAKARLRSELGPEEGSDDA